MRDNMIESIVLVVYEQRDKVTGKGMSVAYGVYEKFYWYANSDHPD